jgi:drug/metabolite transporter (DMT)-like permease
MLLPYLLALSAAILYAIGAVLVKRSGDFGVGPWRTVFISNVVTALCFQPLLAFGGTMHPELWWQPVLVALAFIGGQWFTFVSLEKGDVSVATPVMGIKLLLVAFFVSLLTAEQLRWQLWCAAALATLGIILINRRSGSSRHHAVGFTILTAILAAAAFALFDVLVQKWSPAWGLGRFLPLTIGLSGLLSLLFIAKFKAPLSAIPRPAWPWLLSGTLCIGCQSLLLVSTIANWGKAAQINVIYSSRGLCSVLFVWLFGHWVQSREQHLGTSVMKWRLAGALLMMSAIVLVLA